MYTPIITAADLKTVIYSEKINAITRNDATITASAIDAGISEVKSFLSRFDLAKMFGDRSADTSATYTDELLNRLVKDVVAWHLVTLANVTIDLTLLRTRYEDAIRTLRRIASIEQTPDGWPFLDFTKVVDTPGNPVTVFSRKKRRNNF